MPKTLVLLCAGSLLCASSASAQACLGLPSFERAVHLNVAGEFPDSATSYAAAIGAGRRNKVFANLGAAQVSYEGLEQKATLGFLELGAQLPLGGAQLCPVAGGYLAVGPDDDAAGIKVTSRAATAGLSLGFPLGIPGGEVIPNAAVKYEYLSQKVEEEDIGSFSETFSSGVVDLGLGLVFEDRFAIQPLAHFPFGGERDEASFGVIASVSFAWPLGR